jgi:hypothetical protein
MNWRPLFEGQQPDSRERSHKVAANRRLVLKRGIGLPDGAAPYAEPMLRKAPASRAQPQTVRLVKLH